jgi:hypothetical protein
MGAPVLSVTMASRRTTREDSEAEALAAVWTSVGAASQYARPDALPVHSAAAMRAGTILVRSRLRC